MPEVSKTITTMFRPEKLRVNAWVYRPGNKVSLVKPDSKGKRLEEYLSMHQYGDSLVYTLPPRIDDSFTRPFEDPSYNKYYELIESLPKRRISDQEWEEYETSCLEAALKSEKNKKLLAKFNEHVAENKGLSANEKHNYLIDLKTASWSSFAPLSKFKRIFTEEEFRLAGWEVHEYSPSIDLLSPFLKLENASPQRIRDFASKWGPLWHCYNHTWCIFTPEYFEEISRVHWFRRQGPDGYLIEPVFLWRFWAQKIKAVLDVAELLRKSDKEAAFLSLRKQEKDIMNLWGLVLGFLRSEGDKLEWQSDRKGSVERLLNYSLSDQRAYLAYHVNEYLGNAGRFGPGLSLNWSGRNDKPTLNLEPGFGFLRAVWMQVAQRISRQLIPRDVYCANCGEPDIDPDSLIAPRRTSRTRYFFCKRCKSGSKKSSKNRPSMKLYRQTRREAEQLLRDGKSLKEVAAAVGKDIKQVKKWRDGEHLLKW
ncbi:MAG: hypothetical protein V2A78_09680 [bacterium]